MNDDKKVIVMSDSNTKYDVAIIGSGLGGGTLAAILARNGLKTLLVEAGSHPRYAVGESLVPETGALFKILAKRFDVPELAHLSSFNEVKRHVSSGCGVKKNFTFMFHRDGQKQIPNETTQMYTLVPPLGPDTHLFRQDTDAYITMAALRYGANYRPNTLITDIDINDEGVRLTTKNDEVFSANYLVDASGFRSVVANKFDLVDKSIPFKTNTRSIFNLMVGVKRVEQRNYDLPGAFSQGTLHHIFEGGWFWVIPFDNHSESTNPTCSVGVTVDRDRWPRPESMTPEEEFWSFVNRFPDIAAQFENAKATRQWVYADRLQYMTKQMVGDRFCIMPHAAYFIDPLFSGGIPLTLLTLGSLSSKIMEAVAKKDFSREQFLPIEQQVQRELARIDRLISCSYVTFSNFELWNAWYRIWVLGGFYGAAGFYSLYYRYVDTKDKKFLQMVDAEPYNRLGASGFEPLRELFASAASIVEQVRDEGLDPEIAADKIFKLYRQQDFIPPMLHLDNKARRYPSTFTTIPLFNIFIWAKTKAPKQIHDTFFDMKFTVMASESNKMLIREIAKYFGSLFRLMKSFFITRDKAYEVNRRI